MSDVKAPESPDAELLCRLARVKTRHKGDSSTILEAIGRIVDLRQTLETAERRIAQATAFR